MPSGSLSAKVTERGEDQLLRRIVRGRNLVLSLAVLAIAGLASVSAQQSVTTPDTLATTAKVVLGSSPSYARVSLDGEVDFRGRTPFVATHVPTGKYRLSVFKRGYEPDESVVILRAGQTANLTTGLRRKSRLNAMGRSLFFPGFGQRYAEYPGKGWFLTITEAAGLGTIYVLNTRYNDALDDYRRARFDYENATTISDIEYYRDRMVDEFNRADELHRYLRLTTYASVGIWAYGVLDALLFAPAADDELSPTVCDSERLRLAARIAPGVTALGLRIGF
jgi:TM2 domain-containing membrane protein YozV